MGFDAVGSVVGAGEAGTEAAAVSVTGMEVEAGNGVSVTASCQGVGGSGVAVNPIKT